MKKVTFSRESCSSINLQLLKSFFSIVIFASITFSSLNTASAGGPLCTLPTSHSVDVSGISFTPQNLNVNQGDTVVWTNTEGFHNVNGSTATFPSNPESFLSGTPADAPWVFSFVFTTVGAYDYQCDVHFSMGMVGTITVLPAINCDDFNACTDDTCDLLFGCAFIPVVCDDGDSCTIDVCDVIDGCITFPDPLCSFDCSVLVCDDGDACTSNECDSIIGCLFPPLNCDDLNECTINDCDFVDGCFYQATDCDDLNECTIDECDSVAGCGYADVDCNDFNECTVDDCDSLSGCIYTATLCDDLDACTDDACDSLAGCTNSAVSCDDGDSCTIDGCDFVSGCFYTPDPLCVNPCDTITCDDGDACTTDACDNGLCSFTPLSCDDSNACTNDFCLGGLCQNISVNCDDGDACTDDACDSLTGGCNNTSIICDDFSVCTGAETCDSLTGCVSGTPLLCDDGDSCTIDGCDAIAGCFSNPDPLCSGNPCDSLSPELAFDYTVVCEGETGTVTNLSTGVDAGATYYLDLGNDGSIDLSVPAADLPADSSFIVGAGTADFTVIVVNSTGCSDTLTLSITTPENPELAFDYDVVCEGETGTVTNLSTGVDAGATYYFDINNDGSVEYTVPASALPADSSFTVGPGTATVNVVVVNSTGCSDTLLVSITTPEKPELAFNYDVVCEGETGTVTNLSTGVDAGATYYLDLGNDGSIDLSVPAADLPADSSFIVGAGTADFTVIVVNSTGCSDTLTLSITTPENPELAFDYAVVCEGETGTVTNLSTGVDADATYYLDLGNDGSIDLSVPAADLPADSSFIVGAGTADFTVYVVNSTGCSDTLTLSITTPENPELAFDISSACEGENVTITNLSTGVDAGAIYSLDVNNNGTIDLTLPAAGLPTDSTLVLPAPAGTFGFTVYVVNSTGCSDTLVSTITVLEKPELAFDISSACEGENVTITNLSTGIDAGATYYLDVNNNGTIDLTLPAAGLPTDSSLVLPAPAGTFDFTVYVVNSTGCSDTLVSTITVLEKPELAFDISSACEGENVTITNLSTGVDAGAIYSLDVLNDGTIDLTLPAAGLPTDSSLVLPAPAGTFDFTVYVVNSTGCSDTLVSTITVLEKPELAFDYTVVCAGETGTVTNLSTGVDAGATYYFDINNDGSVEYTVPASALPADSSFTVGPGTATVNVVVVNSTGCSDTLLVSITTPEKPELAFDYTVVCAGETGTVTNLSTGVDAGATYYLDLGNDGSIDLSVPAADLPADSSFTVGAGTADFTVYVVNSTGCSDTLTLSITTPENPELAFDYTVVCAGETGTVTNLSTGVDAGATYYFDINNDGSVEYTVPASALPADSSFTVGPGTATVNVVVVNSTGCSDTLLVSITTPEKPELAFDYQSGCAGDTTYITNLSTGVDADAIYYLDLGSDGSIDFTVPAADLPTDSAVILPISGNVDFTVIVVNSTGCSDTLSSSILLLDCNDNDACTDDLCENLICSYTPVDCNDNDACTDDACDTATGCTYSAVDCNDNDVCTDDACDAATGCTYSAVDCNDNDACTDDACDAATGCVYTPVVCDDIDACTDDVCDPLLGCVFTPVVCDDSDLCTTDKCEFGVCVFVPINCDDGDLCSSDLCVSGSCVFSAINCDDGDSCTIDACDPLIGCTYEADTTCDPCAGVDCNDNDPCTIDSCNNGTCENTPVAADVSIEDVTPENCQGSVTLKAVSTSATSYSWSSGETTAEIDATPGTAYSVTASVGTCQATASYTVPAADELLSSYVLLFAKEVRLNKNTVLSGGVGLTNALGKAKFGNGTDISAASTFVKSKIIQVSGTSTVTTQITEKATVTPPAFEFNTQCSAGQSLQVPDNSTVTLSGSLYNGITIGKNCTVTFTGSEIDIENLYSKENTTIRFTAPCVKLRICKKLQLGANNTFNPDASELVAFVEQDVTVEGGSTVIADIHMLGGKMTVNSGTQSDPNSLTGLFTGNFLEAGDFTTWQQNTTCNPACQPNPPAECDPSERRIYSFTLVDAASDLDIGPLNDGDIIDLALTGPISVRANICNDGLVESVKFFLDGSFFKVENIAFYSIAGDNNGNYNPWNVTPGTYTISATPYSGDNGSGTPGTSYTVTVTIINSALKMGESAVATTPVNELSLNAFPNPFSDKLNIEFTLAEDSRATLELFNVNGQKLATLFDGFVKASVTQKTEFTPESFTDGMIIYRLQTQQGTFFNKVLMVK